MHTKKWILVIVLFFIIVAGLLVLVFVPSHKIATTAIPASIDDIITTTSPLPHTTIVSPLVVTGTARGSWYFEASAPVELRSATGAVIAQGHVTAQGDWMTSEYVPFTATLTFTAQPAGTVGTLVLKNDNPSGDPAREKELDIPVNF
ncbi:MAG: Gmad2 immunoglobulin-like domain-containing protein [Candidatus Adlerbacteria bacterium]